MISLETFFLFSYIKLNYLTIRIFFLLSYMDSFSTFIGLKILFVSVNHFSFRIFKIFYCLLVKFLFYVEKKNSKNKWAILVLKNPLLYQQYRLIIEKHIKKNTFMYFMIKNMKFYWLWVFKKIFYQTRDKEKNKLQSPKYQKHLL